MDRQQNKFDDDVVTRRVVVSVLENMYDVFMPLVTDICISVMDIYLDLKDLPRDQRVGALKAIAKLRAVHPFAPKEDLLEIIRELQRSGRLQNEDQTVDIQSGERQAQGNSQ